MVEARLGWRRSHPHHNQQRRFVTRNEPTSATAVAGRSRPVRPRYRTRLFERSRAARHWPQIGRERTGTLMNRTQCPSDVIALVVLWRLRYKLSLRDLPEMFAVRGIVFSYEAVREWEAYNNVWPAPSARGLFDLTVQSASTYPASEHAPGQDGDPRVPVLINRHGVDAPFF